MSVSDEQAKTLLRNYDRAFGEVKKMLRSNGGGVSAEAKYGQAYDELVKAGLAPKLRRKYRIGGLSH